LHRIPVLRYNEAFSKLIAKIERRVESWIVDLPVIYVRFKQIIP